MYRDQTIPAWASLLLLGIVSPLLAGPADDQYAIGARHYSHARWELAVEELARF